MRILLDTNVLLKLHLQPFKLGPRTRQMLSGEDEKFFSPLSIFELMQKEVIAKHLVNEFVAATAEVGISELPVTTSAVLQARAFGQLRGQDPMDLLILAQAAEARARRYTSDTRLLQLDLGFVKDSSH